MIRAGAALALLRHLLQLISGLLVMYGYLDEGLSEQLIGVGMSVGSALWYLWEKRNADKPDTKLPE